MGILGDQDVMAAPFTAQSLSSKQFETMAMAGQSVDAVLANVPAVRIGTSPIKTDLSIRGIYGNASLFYLNNVPGFFIMASGPMTNAIESADVMVGPSATLNGSVQSYNGPDKGVPGAVYLYTKRPEATDFNRYTQTVSGYGNYGEEIDLNRRLGSDKEWGLRVYGMNQRGGLSIEGASMARRDIFIDLDRKGDTSRTNIFGGYFDDRLKGTERRFYIDPKSQFLPSAPDASKSYDDPNAMYSNTYGHLFTVNHEKDINDHVTWFVNAGANETTVRRYIYASQIDINQFGQIQNTTHPWSDYIFLRNQYFQTGFKTHFATGVIEHDLSLAADWSHRKMYKTSKEMKNGVVTGDIYNGIHFAPSVYEFDVADRLGKKFMYSERDMSFNIADTMKINKWNVMVAGTRRHGNYKHKNSANNIKDDHFAPTYGISYQPNDTLSFYAARAEAITRGSAVPDGYDNSDDFLAPVKTQQNEIGVKYKFGGLMTTLSYFDMKQPNYIDVPTSGPKEKSYLLDGENRYKGMEFTITGALAPKWNIIGGVEYLNARQKKTEGGKNDGLPTDSSADWSGVLALEYTPNDRTSITGRMNYMGTGHFVATNRRVLDIPSYTTFDLFASYKAKMAGMPVKWSLACYNITNDSHWNIQPGQGKKLMLSMPRTFMISAQFDF